MRSSRIFATAGVVVVVALWAAGLAAANPVNTTLPSYTSSRYPAGLPGIPYFNVGDAITVDDGTWTGSGTVSITNSWKRCKVGVGCTDISGATDRHYTISHDDLGGRSSLW